MATDAPPLAAGPFDEAHDMSLHDMSLHDQDEQDEQDEATPSSASEHMHDKDEPDTCRICRGEGTDEEALFFPCKCSGSIKYVHQECLMEWLSHTQKKHCELCKTSFRFTKLYHPGMPNRIPTTVFVRRAALHVLNMFVTWCRGVLVGTVWLCLLPWCMRLVWRSLFWVGDGGWAQDIFPDNPEVAATPRFSPLAASVLRAAQESTESSPSAPGLSVWNFFQTFPHSASNSTVSGSLVWAFAKRILFGSPFPFAPLVQINQDGLASTADMYGPVSNSSGPEGSSSSSLLSEVPFLYWFDSQSANRFVIDVVEGQIITLFVVVAFILIFLIREWVVQQQPVINMVAIGDHAAAQRAADRNDQDDQNVDVRVEDEGDALDPPNNDAVVGAPQEAEANMHEPGPPEPTIRRVRRSSSLRRRREETLQKLETDEGMKDVIATLQSGSPEARSKALTDMGLADTDGLQRSIQVALAADLRRQSGHEATSDDAQNTGDLNTDDVVFPTRTSSLPEESRSFANAESPSSSLPVQRPNMPSRDRSFVATEIRRNLEEGNLWSFDNVSNPPRSAVSPETNVPPSWEDEELEERSDHGPEALSDQEPDSEHSSESWQQVPAVEVGENSDQALEGEHSQDKGKNKLDEDESETLPREMTSTAESSSDDLDDEIKVDSTAETDIPFGASTHTSEVGHDLVVGAQDQQAASDMPVPAAPVEQPQPPQNAFTQILDWMFGDVAPVAPPADDGGNDEHVVRNIAEEAPFVPFLGNEPREPHGGPAIQDPDVAAAAAQAGADVNDQEALEDAEDLEGILELIGMQGPLIGLFQNVLFSAVLISATLTCAIWLPYLWGKIVILFMGSPVSLFIKLPLQLIATMTDLVVDLTLFLMAGATYGGSQVISTLFKLISGGDLPPTLQGRLDSIALPAQSLAESAVNRIGTLLVNSPLSPRPDYFRLSINSHAALRSLQNSTSFALNQTGTYANTVIEEVAADSPLSFMVRILGVLPRFLQAGVSTVYKHGSALLSWIWASKSYKITLDFDLGHNATAITTTMDHWTANDRMIAILAGYGFFAVAGAVYLKRGTPFSSSQQGQKIERIISDLLQQAGGVLKVILIISIEMLAFPLYCGLLLDLAMLPLFKHATLYTRWQFTCDSPWTSGFVHWFIGTCYMFHFALFVSMCRKIMRKGVLYFIRDPDDPTFHPVRDVLERSVTTQLRKIAFSALVYGGLVIVCLGGVVWTLSRATTNVLPIHWTSEAPSLEFPLDLLFYNFLTPVIIKFYKPSEGLHAVFKWWFKTCAGFLRLSNFLFGDRAPKQEGDDGKYVRAPASDQARIPKGQAVFVEVDKDNVRKDGQNEGGVHNSDLVSVVFIPPWFRVRIFCFVFTIWVFMGLSGVSVTILPLIFGRSIFSLFLPPTVEMNDIHAFSLGVYTLGSVFYSAYHAYTFFASLTRPVPDPMSTFRTVAATSSRISLRVLRFSYVWASLIFAIPFLCAVLIELYFLMPLHTYLGPKEPHVVHLIQDWTLGFLYARLAARLVFSNRNSRPARAFTAVIRDGYLNPDARIATRCFLLPVMAMFLIAIAIPSSLSFITTRTLYYGASAATKKQVWRFSFPAVGLAIVAMWASNVVIRLLVRWRLVVRDEVYLIGERLHNFGEKKAPMQSAPSSPVVTPQVVVAEGAAV